MLDLFQHMSDRDMIQDATPGLQERLRQGPITGYVGFDPSAPSLHVGNLVPMMALAWLRRAGGVAIAVLGGGTGVVGDPSGKRAERPLMPLETLAENVARIKGQLTRFLSGDGTPESMRVYDNADWLRGISLLDFLRDTGKHFTLSYMLQKEAVKSRMESGISFTEFAYMLVQAYDFWHLHRTEDCQLQMGGSDQWGNITAGIELVARREGAKAHGLVVPLLTTAKGTKFGKTEVGNVWLDPDMTTPYRFYQFWLNTDDRDVGRFLKLFTFTSVAEIDRLLQEHRENPGLRKAQRHLAEDVTTRIHGQETTVAVRQASRILFGDTDIQHADAEVFRVLANEIPVGQVTRSSFVDGLPLVEALLTTNLAHSKSDARRGIRSRGYAVNGCKVEEDAHALGIDDLMADRYILLQKGKKNYALLVVE